jgi:hypothetical protein
MHLPGSVLADGNGHALGQNGAETLLPHASPGLAWAAVRAGICAYRVRRADQLGSGTLAVAALVLAPLPGIKTASGRPSTNAKTTILSSDHNN